jgi:hypothetical protein
MALATVMNCWGETDLSSQRLRKVWNDPDLRFDISTPLSRSVRIFHPSLPTLPNLFESEADSNSCMQLSLAKCTYLLSESSLMDLHTCKTQNENLESNQETKMNTAVLASKLITNSALVVTKIGCKVLDRYCSSVQELLFKSYFFTSSRSICVCVGVYMHRGKEEV